LRNIKKTKNLILIIIISFLLVIFFKSIKENRYKRLEKKELNNLRIKIKNCIDLENKNNRKLNENIELIEYCINKLGIQN